MNRVLERGKVACERTRYPLSSGSASEWGETHRRTFPPHFGSVMIHLHFIHSVWRQQVVDGGSASMTRRIRIILFIQRGLESRLV